MPANPRLLTPEKRGEDAEASLRPLALSDFTGQEALRNNLKVFIEAAKARREALDHYVTLPRGVLACAPRNPSAVTHLGNTADGYRARKTTLA